jgi:antitoxin component YwqK of YwqJK toxin-antitoxin module
MIKKINILFFYLFFVLNHLMGWSQMKRDTTEYTLKVTKIYQPINDSVRVKFTRTIETKENQIDTTLEHYVQKFRESEWIRTDYSKSINGKATFISVNNNPLNPDHAIFAEKSGLIMQYMQTSGQFNTSANTYFYWNGMISKQGVFYNQLIKDGEWLYFEENGDTAKVEHYCVNIMGGDDPNPDYFEKFESSRNGLCYAGFKDGWFRYYQKGKLERSEFWREGRLIELK